MASVMRPTHVRNEVAPIHPAELTPWFLTSKPIHRIGVLHFAHGADCLSLTHSRIVPVLLVVIRWSSSREEIERGAPGRRRARGRRRPTLFARWCYRTGAWSTALPSVVQIDVQRPGRAANIGATREWGCGRSAVTAAGVKPADYIVRTTTLEGVVRDEMTGRRRVLLLAALGFVLADMRNRRILDRPPAVSGTRSLAPTSVAPPPRGADSSPPRW